MALELKTDVETMGFLTVLWGFFCGLVGKIFSNSKSDKLEKILNELEKEMIEVKATQRTGIRDREEMKIDIRDIREIVSKYFGMNHD